MNAKSSLSDIWSRHARLLVLCGLTMVAYFAAINRAQTLLWAIAALLSATLITGFAWPRWLVRHMQVSRTGPDHAAEGESITFHVEVTNNGWLPRFMVELTDALPFAAGRAGSPSTVETILGVVAYIPGRGRRRFDAGIVCEKRGFYHLGPVAMASSFPLGLVQARRKSNEGIRTLTVYPAVFPIAGLPLAGVHTQMHRGSYPLAQGAGAEEFAGLRQYVRGDNPRHIHWRTTARLGELVVKEFEPLASARVCLVLDLSADANVGKGREATLEYAIRIAASIADFSCANGIPTRLLGQGRRALAVQAGTGGHHRQGIMDELAVAEADGATPYSTVLELAAMECLHGETVVAFLSEPDDRRNSTFEALACLHARGAHLIVIDFQRESFIADDSLASRWRRHGKRERAASASSGLAASYHQVSCGDDLTRLFHS